MANPIGFIGLGNMGFPMALRLIEAGHTVVGCDIQPGMQQRFAERGGQWAATPKEVASR